MLRTNSANPKEDPKTGKTAYVSFDVDDFAVRRYGDTAVVTGRSKPPRRMPRASPPAGQFQTNTDSSGLVSNRVSGRSSHSRDAARSTSEAGDYHF